MLAYHLSQEHIYITNIEISGKTLARYSTYTIIMFLLTAYITLQISTQFSHGTGKMAVTGAHATENLYPMRKRNPIIYEVFRHLWVYVYSIRISAYFERG